MYYSFFYPKTFFLSFGVYLQRMSLFSDYFCYACNLILSKSGGVHHVATDSTHKVRSLKVKLKAPKAL